MTIGTKTIHKTSEHGTGEIETGGVMVEYMHERTEDAVALMQSAGGVTHPENKNQARLIALVGMRGEDAMQRFLQALAREGQKIEGTDSVCFLSVNKKQLAEHPEKVEQELRKQIEQSKVSMVQGIFVTAEEKITLAQMEQSLETLKKLQILYEIDAIYMVDENERVSDQVNEWIVFGEKGMLQQGTYQQIYKEPATLAAAVATGEVNVLRGKIDFSNSYAWIYLNGNMQILAPFSESKAGEVLIAVRPEQVHFAKEGLWCKVLSIKEEGSSCEYLVELADQTKLRVVETSKKSYYGMRPGSISHILFDNESILYFDAQTMCRMERK